LANLTYARGLVTAGHGLALMKLADLWPKVAKILGENDGGPDVTADQVRETLRDIVERRNQIAHTADRNPSPLPARAPITLSVHGDHSVMSRDVDVEWSAVIAMGFINRGQLPHVRCQTASPPSPRRRGRPYETERPHPPAGGGHPINHPVAGTSAMRA
jgi:hypothetical protein